MSLTNARVTNCGSRLILAISTKCVDGDIVRKQQEQK